jgi:hypothetical protein
MEPKADAKTILSWNRVPMIPRLQSIPMLPGFIILFYYYYLSLILLVTRGIQYNPTFFVFRFLRLNRVALDYFSSFLFSFKILNSSITDIFLAKIKYKFKIIPNQMMSLKQRNFRSKVLVQMINLITLIAVFYILYQFHNKY